MHCRLLVLLTAGPLAAFPLQAQDVQAPPVDSLVVEGNQRLTAAQIQGTAGIILHQPVNYRDVQRAILVKQGEAWKLSSMPTYYLWDYSWYQEPPK